MLNERVRISLLYDFYGPLLTDRQQAVFELYYEHDLSLGEIAGQFGVTRQAVHDILRRSGEILEEYEQKLGLVARHLERRAALGKALDLLAGSNEEQSVRVREILEEVLRED
ncbi:YlxM family DNA-binding protein [Desulforudis sp. 1088]|uniref:YlxM family DNA-binding protein n=1 Tax=unclassified Candidatus Desulforudis TaxID=2635950 RepID=UPI0034968369